MAKRFIHKSRIEPMLTYSGVVIYLNKYTEFKNYIKEYAETNFSKHYTLFGNQTGVYRFNVNGLTHYVGYSQNLKDRVRNSFFNHCFQLANVEFQYILCDTQDEAMDVEAYYIKLLQPKENFAGKINMLRLIKVEHIPEFCNPMKIYFNDYWNNKP